MMSDVDLQSGLLLGARLASSSGLLFAVASRSASLGTLLLGSLGRRAHGSL